MPDKRRAMILALLLAAVTLALYWPVTRFEFINFDDSEYIIYNTPIQHGITGALLAWAVETRHASNWHPLTWVSHALDYEIYGSNPAGHHLTNLLFHTANVVLLFLVLLQLTGATWRSALVAALFAWHPLHVESVAWVSERKDVLSTFFLLLTIAAYGRYARESGKRQIAWYGVALFLFVLGLMSKPMLVTLPFALLLLDFWPLQRPWTPGLLFEKIPFILLAACDGIATVWAQKGANSVISLSILPLPPRIANALVSCVLYLWKTIWPADLAVPYPYHFWGFWPALAAAILLAGVTAWVIWRRRQQPFLLAGWFWFLLTLAPVIGLTQTGVQSMADRYTYVPLIGIFLMVAWGLPGSWAQWPRPGVIFIAATSGVLLFLMMGAELQLQYWRNSVALFSHTVTVTRGNIMAEYNLAEALARGGDEADAVAHYQKALAITPNPVEAHYNSQTQAHYNLGLIERKEKQWADAEIQFRAFLRDEPETAAGHANLGVALVGLGRDDEALAEFRVVTQLRPDQAGRLNLLGALESAEAETGHLEKALATAGQLRDCAIAEGRADVAYAASKRMESYRSKSR